jgi:RNA polymerase sigma-70 factor (ECF subfamily)
LNQENKKGPASPSNAELIARAQRGEEKAFEILFDQYKKRVYSLCLRVTRNPAEAEDLTQDAFLQVFRKIHTFRGQSAFSTWLHRLSLNIVLMRLRKKTISVTPLDSRTTEDEFDESPAEWGTPDFGLTGSIDRVNLERAVGQLPPGYSAPSYSTMSKAINTTKLLRCWVRQSEIRNRSCTKPVWRYVSYCEK